MTYRGLAVFITLRDKVQAAHGSPRPDVILWTARTASRFHSGVPVAIKGQYRCRRPLCRQRRPSPAYSNMPRRVPPPWRACAPPAPLSSSGKTNLSPFFFLHRPCRRPLAARVPPAGRSNPDLDTRADRVRVGGRCFRRSRAQSRRHRHHRRTPASMPPASNNRSRAEAEPWSDLHHGVRCQRVGHPIAYRSSRSKMRDAVRATRSSVLAAAGQGSQALLFALSPAWRDRGTPSPALRIAVARQERPATPRRPSERKPRSSPPTYPGRATWAAADCRDRCVTAARSGAKSAL